MSSEYGVGTLGMTVPDIKLALRGESATLFVTKELCEQASELERQGKVVVTRSNVEGVDAFYLDGVLTADECAILCKAMDGSDAMSFWSCLGRENEEARLFRDADTVEVQHQSLSSLLWRRIEPLLNLTSVEMPSTEPDDDPRWERELPGTWHPSDVNHDFLFVRYPSGGAFAPHSDGRAVANFNTRSFYSIVLFLNDIPEGQGGGTSFYTPDAVKKLRPAEKSGRWTADPSLILETVQPRAGRMLIFEQSLVHEGVPPLAPNLKYIIRSDIMYKRIPAICDSPTDLQAYNMFNEAERLSEDGHPEEAVVMFQRVAKMSPALANLLGL